jgi:hypothetical protein
MLADVAQAGGAQQGIAKGMQHHVAVGMGGKALRMIDGHAAQHQPAAVLESMGIEALTDSHRRSCCRR